MMQRFYLKALVLSNVFICLSNIGCFWCFGRYVKLRGRKILPSSHVLSESQFGRIPNEIDTTGETEVTKLS
jgi:hypothetical protein